MTKKSAVVSVEVADEAKYTGKITVSPATSGYAVEDMFSSIEALKGARVEFVGLIPAEVSRQANQYVLLRVRQGRRTFRLILAFTEVMRPCPAGDVMWDYMESFFTPDEIKARFRNKPLDLPSFEAAE